MTRDEILNMPEGIIIDSLIVENVISGFRNYRVFTTNYSTDIGTAFEMAERLRQEIGTCKFYIIVDPKLGDNVRAVFDPLLEDEYFEASAKTAPLAICRAALLVGMK